MRIRALFLVFIAGCLIDTGSADAQSELSIRAIPRAGLAAPDAYFYEVFTNWVGDGPVEWTTGSLGRAFVAGLGVEVDTGHEGVRFRAEILRSFDSWLLAGHGIIIPRVFFEPPQEVRTWYDVPATITLTSAQVVLPLRARIWRLEPYVLAGVGGKFYSFGESTRPNEVGAVLPSDGFTWGGDLGLGATLSLFGLDFDLQVRDAVTQYWDKTQHDLLYTGALVWAVR
jgi:hypothetical protein